MRFLFLTLLLLLPLHAAFPDGKWNGKPWDKATLEAEVLKENPDALAEWAYCSFHCYVDIPYDLETAKKRAAQAAEKGSVFGKALTAYLTLDSLEPFPVKTENALPLIKEASDAGHPWALYLLTEAEIRGQLLPRVTEGRVEILKKLAEQGVIDAADFLGEIYAKGTLGVIDTEEAHRLWSDLLLNHRHPKVIYRFHALEVPEGRFPVMEDRLSEKIIEKTAEFALEKTALGEPDIFFLHHYRLLREGTDPHRAVAGIMRAANAGSRRAMDFCTSWGRFYIGKDPGGRRFLAGDLYSNNELTLTLARSGSAWDSTLSRASYQLFERKDKSLELTEGQMEGLGYIFGLLAEDHNSSDFYQSLAYNYDDKYSQTKPNAKWLEASLLVFSYNAPFARYSRYRMVCYLCDERLPTHDPVKGYVAAEWLVPKTHRVRIEEVTGMRDKMRAKLTEEQLAEAAELKKRGYPHSVEFTREFYMELQEKNLIPETLPMREPLEAPEEPRDEVRLKPLPNPALLALLLRPHPLHALLKADAPSDEELLNHLLGEEVIPEPIRPHLVKLITGDLEKLQKLLLSVEEPARKKRAAEILSRLKTETAPVVNPLGLYLGWYFFVDLPDFNTLALVWEVEPDSPAAKAGFIPEDAIEKCEGIPMNTGPDSRNQVTRLILAWPPHTPLTFTVLTAKPGKLMISYRNFQEKRKVISVRVPES